LTNNWNLKLFIVALTVGVRERSKYFVILLPYWVDHGCNPFSHT
jgi:hypothetical protein